MNAALADARRRLMSSTSASVGAAPIAPRRPRRSRSRVAAACLWPSSQSSTRLTIIWTRSTSSLGAGDPSCTRSRPSSHRHTRHAAAWSSIRTASTSFTESNPGRSSSTTVAATAIASPFASCFRVGLWRVSCHPSQRPTASR